jgi:small conductance mechanosensitive channel
MDQIQPYLDKILELVLIYGVRMLGSVAILFVGRIFARIISSMTIKIMKRHKVDQTLVSFIGNLLYVGLLTFVVVAAVSKLGIQTTSFVAILGAAGLAIGLALQGSLSNFAAGVLMIIFKQMKVNDFVEAGGTIGVVEEISIFTTSIITPDNKKVIVPNSAISSGNIINYSAQGTRRIDLTAGCSYSDNLGDVKKVLQEVCADDRRVLLDPVTVVGVSEMADSSINFAVMPWVKTEDYWDVLFDLNQAIKERFDEKGITIPFPQQDIHIIPDKII